jgi:hypothetical protein
VRHLTLVFFLAAVNPTTVPALPAELPAGPAKLSLLVYNLAQVDPATLEWAESEAARILANAGVGTVWHRCTVSPAPPDPGCEAAFGPTAVTLKLLPGSMARRFPRKSDELGFVAQPSEGEFAIHAMIFLDRVEDLATRRACPRKVLVAHAMAHEIGHALLGTGSHGRRGIMRAYWGPREMQEATQGLLKFTPQQAVRLQSRLQRRSEARKQAGGS